jgi:hypothetical protein
MPMRKTMRWSSGIPAFALDHRFLHFDGATHGIDDAAKLDDAAVASALDHSPTINQVAAQRSKPGENAIFVRSRETAVSDHIRDQDRRKFPGLAHSASLPQWRLAQQPGQRRPA